MASKTSKSGNPAKRAAAAKAAPARQPSLPPSGPTSADAWVSRTAGPEEDILLPSGNVARVRRVGPEAFLTQGLLPDSVTPVVEKAIRQKKGLRPQDQADLAKDPKQVGAMMEMLDRMLCYAVVQPVVVMPPPCKICGKENVQSVPEHDKANASYHEFQPLDRQPGVLYADFVDLDDKMFIMNFVVGGTRDLERFRSEFGAGLAGLAAFSGDQV